MAWETSRIALSRSFIDTGEAWYQALRWILSRLC